MSDDDIVNRNATLPEAVSLDDTVLVGIIDRPEGRTAMLRFADGEIDTVAAGDLTRDGRVAAIDTDAVVMVQGGRTRRLQMPTG